MWAIKVLSGSLQGQVFPIRGTCRIGRHSGCDIQIKSAGISKEHMEIRQDGTGLRFRDLNSANGVFVNGLRLGTGELKEGDKLGLHDVLLSVVQVKSRANQPVRVAQGAVPARTQSQNLPSFGNVGMNAVPSESAETWKQQAGPPPSSYSLPSHRTWSEKFSDLVDSKLMPAVYSLVEAFDYRWVVLGLMLVFVLGVSVLSTIPMRAITEESVTKEAQRRALTVAKALAYSNEKVIRTGEPGQFRSDLVFREDGVRDVYILGKDGLILAPSERLGRAPKEASLAQSLRGQTREVVLKLGTGWVAAVPVIGFDPELNQNVARAYAVVVYDSGELMFDDGRAISLFTQVLALALLFGGFLYLILVRLMEYPLLALHRAMDAAAANNQDNISVPLQISEMTQMLPKISSWMVLSRQAQSAHIATTGAGARNHEMENLILMIPVPAMVIDSDGKILRCNPVFDQETGMESNQWLGQPVQAISDQALQLNIMHLLQAARQQVDAIAADAITIHDRPFRSSCQAVTRPDGQIEYFIVLIAPETSAGAAA